MGRAFSTEELRAAMAKIANGEVPSWMNSLEKQAYALGIITDADIENCPECKGRGYQMSCSPYSDAACYCPDSKGKVITEQGKKAVKEAFPEYRIR